MNAENFASFLESPSKLYQLSYQELKNLVADYPYAANLKLLLALKGKMENDPRFEDYIHQLAASTFDRNHLRTLYLHEFPAITDLATTVEERLELKNLFDLDKKEIEYIPLHPEEETPKEIELKVPTLNKTTIPEEPILEEEIFEEEISITLDTVPPVVEETVEEVINTTSTIEEEEGISEVFLEEEVAEEPAGVEEISPSPTPKTTPTTTDFAQPMAKRHFQSWKNKTTPGDIKARLGKFKTLGIEQLSFEEKVKKVSQTAKQSLLEKPELATETLAHLLAQQGQHKKAVKMYERLSLLFPEKRRYFAGIIEELQQKS